MSETPAALPSQDNLDLVRNLSGESEDQTLGGEKTRSEELVGLQERLARLRSATQEDGQRFAATAEKQRELELGKVVDKTGAGRLDDQVRIFSWVTAQNLSR